MKYLGLGLLLLWFGLLLLKHQQLIKKPNFSYKKIFFGNLVWYQNSRNWILLIAVLLCELTLTLKMIYFILALTGLLLLLISLFDRHLVLKKHLPTAGISFLGILLILGSCWILVKL